VLRDCYSEIILDANLHSRKHGLYLKIRKPFYDSEFRIEPTLSSSQLSIHETQHNPVFRACELLEACMLSENDEHNDCALDKVDTSNKAASLPRRLLDLSYNDNIVTLDVQACIATARATVDELSKYCTLSYRWGGKPPDCMLSTQFIDERVTSFVNMPQTFKDAIIVARGLKIRFLWIDALCIIQPSAHGNFSDWNAEGPRMWLVYQNAICTIAATCSDNPNTGFLWKFGTDYNPPCSIHEQTEDGTLRPLFFFSNESAFYGSVVASSLNRRGWVAQERLLSRRILHFTEERVFWECKAANTTHYSPTPYDIGYDVRSQHACHLTFEGWLDFITFYSASDFTRPTDRLIALSSIAKSVPAEQFGHTYFAGIWRKHLSTSLSWYSEDPCSIISRASCLDVAPSWSWASVPGRIQHGSSAFVDTSITLIGIQDVWVSLTQSSNPYGNLREGALKLHARLCDMCLPTDNTRNRPQRVSSIPEYYPIDTHLYWDELQDHSVREKMYAVVPLSIGYFDDFSVSKFNALVVTSLLSTGNESTKIYSKVYRRIGYLELSCHWEYDAEGKVYKQPDPQSVFDRIFPNTTLQTMVIM
jgi:hypothetical protein